ncbi:MAG: hypothetical protein WB766_20450 [Roseiarcus sp.]
MSNAAKKPHYAAVILNDAGEDMGPIRISDANDDDEAGRLAMDRGAPIIGAKGLARAKIQIVKDGKDIRTIPVEAHK